MSAAWIALGVLVAFGLGAAAVMAWSARRLLRRPSPALPRPAPPVSILKPLKGLDPDLEANLESVFRLDYPDFEVVLGAEDAADPALDVARRVAARHPGVRSTVLSDPSTVGWNPKVNNLANLARLASHDVLLISDSNIRVGPGYLGDLVAHQAATDAGLVWSIFRGTGGAGIGGALETLQLNLYVSGGTAALLDLAGRPCAVGKSMLLRKADLDAIGGFAHLGRFLAEDQVCAEDLAARGRPVVMSGHLIDNVLGRRTLREFAARHLRWARLRRQVSGPGYAGEFLLNPVFIAALGAAGMRTAEALALALGALLAMSAIDLAAERSLGLKRPIWQYPFLELALSLVKGLLWIVPFFSSTVVWRGNALRIGPRTAIEPAAAEATVLAR